MHLLTYFERNFLNYKAIEIATVIFKRTCITFWLKLSDTTSDVLQTIYIRNTVDMLDKLLKILQEKTSQLH